MPLYSFERTVREYCTVRADSLEEAKRLIRSQEVPTEVDDIGKITNHLSTLTEVGK